MKWNINCLSFHVKPERIKIAAMEATRMVVEYTSFLWRNKSNVESLHSWANRGDVIAILGNSSRRRKDRASGGGQTKGVAGDRGLLVPRRKQAKSRRECGIRDSIPRVVQKRY